MLDVLPPRSTTDEVNEMYVLVATKETQGDRGNDYGWTVEGELVFVPTIECREPRCGCSRGFAGVSSHRATTTAMVVDRPELDHDGYRDALFDAMTEQGYGVAGESLQYMVPPGTLPDSHERLRVELLDSEEAREEGYALYATWARTQTGMLERSSHVWSSLVTQQDRAFVAYRGRGGALEGYAIVAYRTDLPRDTRFLEVEEIVWLGTEARLGLYGWLHSLGDQWERVLVRSLPSQRFADYIQEPRLPHGAAPPWGLWAPAATLMMGPMFRLLDVESAFARRTVNDGSMTVALHVQDAVLAINDGRWFLSCDAGHASLARKGTATVTLALDISTLSRIYIGALTPTQAVAAGLMTCDRTDLLPKLDALLALPEPWTFDRF